MSDLPPELLVEILVRLRHKDILLCLCVCKVWNATIDDQQFIKTHLQRSIQTKPFRSILVSRTLIRWPYPMGSSYCFYDDNIGSGGEKALRQAWASAYIWEESTTSFPHQSMVMTIVGLFWRSGDSYFKETGVILFQDQGISQAFLRTYRDNLSPLLYFYRSSTKRDYRQ
ncbi:hypothetical protein FF1_026057 [Malus domestica]|uniref:F-box domain-containing protein n=1 Tax=Malus domestica TaxID=3750 RepID=A0A498KEA3_MALDO|nr:hypothetical protein DVH24_017729 [Malus domestica]